MIRFVEQPKDSPNADDVRATMPDGRVFLSTGHDVEGHRSYWFDQHGDPVGWWTTWKIRSAYARLWDKKHREERRKKYANCVLK